MSGRMVSRALQFLLFIYAARVLGAKDFGLFSFAFALVSLMAVFMDLGISRYTVQQLSRDLKKIPAFMGACFVVKGVLIPVGLLLIISVGLQLQKESGALCLLLVLGGYVALDSLTMTFYAVFQAEEKMDYQAVIVVISNTIMSITGLVLLYFLPNLLIFGSVYLFGGCLRFALSGWWCIKKYGPPAWESNIALHLDLLKMGIPFALVTIFVTIYYYIDTLILTAYCGKEIVGYYNASYRLVEGPLFIISALTTALFPAASKLFTQDKHKLKDLMNMLFQRVVLIGFTLSFVIAFFSDQLIGLIYGIEYQKASQALPVLIFSVSIIMPSTILGTAIRAMDKQAISAWVTGLGAFLNVVLNLIVIPRYSFVGAAWTTLTTEAFVLITYFVLVWRYLGPIIYFGSVFRILAFFTCLVVFLCLTVDLGIWVQLVGYGAIILPLLVILGFVKMKELTGTLRGLLRRKKATL
jgi:O-antigen/teichoic acid export membrane protein